MESNGSGWRYASADERELLLGFQKGHTFPSWGSAVAGHDPRGHEDARMALLGTSFRCGVVGYKLAHVLHQFKLLKTMPSINIVKPLRRV